MKRYEESEESQGVTGSIGAHYGTFCGLEQVTKAKQAGVDRFQAQELNMFDF